MIEEIKCNGCEECNNKAPLFKMLTVEELSILNQNRYSVRYHPGEIIIKQGTKAEYFISLINGFSKMYIEGHNGRNLILDFMKPWKLIAGPGIHMQGKQNFSMVAIEESLICFIDSKNFQKVLHMNSTFADVYLGLISSNYYRTLDRMVCLSQKQMHGRIADALIYLSEEIHDNHMISSLITRQDIADYTSLSKDSAIRILKEFERDGLIELRNGGIEVLEGKRLHDISSRG